jgi:hypothetical protein
MVNKEKTVVCQGNGKTEKCGYGNKQGKEFFPFSYTWVKELKWNKTPVDYEWLCTKYVTLFGDTVYMLEAKRAKIVGQGKIAFYKYRQWRTIDITNGKINFL